MLKKLLAAIRDERAYVDEMDRLRHPRCSACGAHLDVNGACTAVTRDADLARWENH